ncbi:uncharacterized protein LOC119613274 [Lucilia sericata]|uniref:uncharacterized protein LOC119613274 n=1 Tax=Lucilia sericata TaxID=13632 RepID=UPI0018A83307|nr:uncharacterized protein LOC119613274 [Lucilia sericata]
MTDIINVLEKPLMDERIIKKDYHTYTPYIQSFNNNDEIRISIQNQDLYVLPSESFLYIEGSVLESKSGKSSKNIKLKNNFVPNLFEEIRYELNGVEIDRTRHLGISGTIKNVLSLNDSESIMMGNASWSYDKDIDVGEGFFNFYVSLKSLLGFAEDYNKIIMNCKHELILLRTKNDDNIVHSTEAGENRKISIQNISWRIPHVKLSDYSKLNTIKIIKSGNVLPVAFRSWDCHYHPQLSTSQNHIWNVKFSANRERPRFVLIAFQHENKLTHCNLNNLKVHLNSESYPYDDLNVKFDNQRYAILYDMYVKFQPNFYMREPQPLLSAEQFKEKAPIIVIDVSHQNETVTTGPIDIKVEFAMDKIAKTNTSAYCLLIHDRLIEYSPLTASVKKIV